MKTTSIMNEFTADIDFERVNLKALVVSPNAECLKACCRELSRSGVEVDGATSTESAHEMISRAHYHLMIIDPRHIDLHRLQLHAAMHSFQQNRAMPVVAVLDNEDLVVEHRWGEGNDFDERLSYPLVTEEVKTFVHGCARYHQLMV